MSIRPSINLIYLCVIEIRIAHLVTINDFTKIGEILSLDSIRDIKTLKTYIDSDNIKSIRDINIFGNDTKQISLYRYTHLTNRQNNFVIYNGKLNTHTGYSANVISKNKELEQELEYENFKERRERFSAFDSNFRKFIDLRAGSQTNKINTKIDIPIRNTPTRNTPTRNTPTRNTGQVNTRPSFMQPKLNFNNESWREVMNRLNEYHTNKKPQRSDFRSGRNNKNNKTNTSDYNAALRHFETKYQK